ncbi:histone-lysine N-methyltransferase SETMAR-like [Hippopotamus amphibius kiboko]|uniref:histone-lysine N-methyltransferase SETMAR-like n=1 Tax=Hippopotamus amphibius kiboko TaxID=575201 RepID=UPI002599EAB9|nr:histone-lysine N-methyltransferase SETMAR-like [Hippopotamus amphibius kiboko]
MQEIASILKTSTSSVENHLPQLGYVNRFDVRVPHKLSEKTLLDCISENVLFLKQIVMGNEKWILCNNVEWKKSWGKRNELPPATPKASLHPKKVMVKSCLLLFT